MVAFLESFSSESLSYNFEDGVRIQAELTRRNIGIVAIRENIDTREGSAAAKFFRRSMLAPGAYQVDSASERIRLGLDRARQWKASGSPSDLNAAAKLFCRMIPAQGAYQVEATSEKIKAGLERARAEGRRPGRPPGPTPGQV